MRTGRKKKSTDHQKLDGGKSQLALEELGEMRSFLGNRPWQELGQEMFQGNQGSSSSSALPPTNQPQQLAITYHKQQAETKVKWTSISTHVLEAKQAHERLLRDAQKLVGTCKKSQDTDLQNGLRDVMVQLQASLQQCFDMITWEDSLTTCFNCVCLSMVILSSAYHHGAGISWDRGGEHAEAGH